LPEKIAKFNGNINVRIYLFIGTLSTIYIISGLGLKYYPNFFYIGLSLSLPFVIYKIVLIFFIFKQYYINLKNGKYTVINYSLLSKPLIISKGTVNNAPTYALARADKFQTIIKFTIGTLKIIINTSLGTSITITYLSELSDYFSEIRKI